MPPFEHNYEYSVWCGLDKDGNPCTCNAKWDLNHNDFSMKVETDKHSEIFNELDMVIDILKNRYEKQGYLTVSDLLDIFDEPSPELYNAGKKVNPFNIYCGSLDDYKKAMIATKKRFYNYISQSDKVDEIKSFSAVINQIDDALEKLYSDEEDEE